MTLFLIGPSAGYFDGNRKGFTEAAGTLRERGIDVVDPRQLDDADYDPRMVYRALFDCDGVVVMPGWKQDEQARLIVGVAALVGYEVLALPNLSPVDAAELPTVRA
jgi:hypothetical protein